MSKDLFTLMREQELAHQTPTKKQVIDFSNNFADTIIANGEHNLYELYAQLKRTQEAIDTIESKIKDKLPQENFEAFGLKGTFRNGGAIANYTEDPIYAEIKSKLDDRKMLLDVALKSNNSIYDNEGIEVPKVSQTERKSTLAISW